MLGGLIGAGLIIRNIVNRVNNFVRQYNPRPSGGGNPVSGFINNAYRAVRNYVHTPAGNAAAQRAAEQRAREEAAARERERIRREKERKRRLWQGKVDKAVGIFQSSISEAAKKRPSWLNKTLNKLNVNYQGDWNSLFTKSGEFKGQNTGGGIGGWLLKKSQELIDPDVRRARQDWSNWYNSDAGFDQRMADNFAKIRRNARLEAESQINKVKKGNGGWFDALTLGPERRAGNARQLAESKLGQLGQWTKQYESRFKHFNRLRAQKQQELEAAKYGSRAEFDRANADFMKWQRKHIEMLESSRARFEGLAEAYDFKSKEEINTPIARAAGWFGRHIAKPVADVGKGIFQYTLGSGDKNIPSLVTAPSRAVNALGNWLNPNRNINTHDGRVVNRLKEGQNAWEASFNQRNLNLAVAKDIDKGRYVKTLYERLHKEAGGKQSFEQWYSGDRKKNIDNMYNKSNWQRKATTNITEFALDPLALIPASRAGRGISYLGKAVKGTKAGGWFSSKSRALSANLEKTKLGRGLKWLGSEYRSPEDKLADAVKVAKGNQARFQSEVAPRIKDLRKKLGADSRLDVSVFDDFAKLTDFEAKVLQRMVGNKISVRDRLFLSGKNAKPVREKLTKIAEKWDEFSAGMQAADGVRRSRFGRGKKFYSPRTAWLTMRGKTLDDYNFRLRKKNSSIQTAQDLRQGAIDRYFKSKIDDVYAEKNVAKRAQLKADLEKDLKWYDDNMRTARADVESAYSKTRTPLNRLRRLNARIGPNAIWKKSVLKYRPAWTVNNILYNTQANFLASGARGLSEQAKMLRPGYWRKAMSDVPDNVKSQIAREIGGKSKLNRFYGGVENWSRVAAFRALKKKGLSDADAVKRVDAYLFNYKDKGYDKLIKSVIPFWQFQKGTAKASVRMPFDRPYSAKAYNELDQYQRESFDKEFETMRDDLKKMGYTDEEIDAFKAENAKYYSGRLKIGDKWINTPFNTFSEDNLASGGINPFLSAASESALSQDSWGNKVAGKDASFMRRLVSKFPQAELGKKAWESLRVEMDKSRPNQRWIAEKGSDGFGLTKERQGYDKSSSNYDRRLDPRDKLAQDVGAFVGVPRSTEFNKETFLRRKLMQKVKTEYFAEDWSKMSFEESSKKQAAIFKKYGITADEFYKGELGKYDTRATRDVKKQKEEARALNKKLFEEYGKQPYGQRTIWATKKLKELVDNDYFAKNPYLKSFEWLNPVAVARAEKTSAYRLAKSSGDWTAFNRKYGTSPAWRKRAPSEKAILVREALRTGDWSKYRQRYGTKKSVKALFWEAYSNESDPAKRRQMLRDNPQFAKHQPKSESEILEAKFWASYAKANKEQRRQMLRDNPQYNRRADWSQVQWDAWKKAEKDDERRRLRGWGNIASLVDDNLSYNQKKAEPILTRKQWSRRPINVKWRV